MKNTSYAALVSFLLLALAGCDSAPPPQKLSRQSNATFMSPQQFKQQYADKEDENEEALRNGGFSSWTSSTIFLNAGSHSAVVSNTSVKSGIPLQTMATGHTSSSIVSRGASSLHFYGGRGA